MKTLRLMTVALLALSLAPSLSAQTNVSNLTDGLASFTDNVVGSLPFAASAGMDWSNAYIGQLIDTDFPFVHVGAGLSAGFTTLPSKAISPLLKAFGQPDVAFMGMPFMVANLRVGGMVWPFDVGLKVGFLPDSLSKFTAGYTFTYSNIGLDLRYNLMKSDLVLPDIMVGGGFNVLKATAVTTLGTSQSFTASGSTLTMGAPVATMDLSSLEFEAKAQVSKTLLWILTPYVGTTVSYGSASAKTGVASTVTADGAGSYTTVAAWAAGVPALANLTSTGFSNGKDGGAFGLKIYGGSSVNILILKIDGQFMYNLFDGSIGMSLGGRIQL